MRQALVVWLAAGLLAGCGDKTVQEKRADDARDVAMVERMSQAPFKPIRPQPLTADDIDRYDLGRSGCMFRPGNDGKAPALFVAQEDQGYVKIDGKLQPLAVKSGSAELPSGAHSTYIGLNTWIELVAQAGAGAETPGGGGAWPSRLVIHDSDERVAFNSLGQVSCASGAGG